MPKKNEGKERWFSLLTRLLSSESQCIVELSKKSVAYQKKLFLAFYFFILKKLTNRNLKVSLNGKGILIFF